MGPTARSGDDAEPTYTTLRKAGETMQEYLKTNGDVGCKELRVFCKNKKWFNPESEEGKEEDRKTAVWIRLDEVVDPRALAAMSLG